MTSKFTIRIRRRRFFALLLAMMMFSALIPMEALATDYNFENMLNVDKVQTGDTIIHVGSGDVYYMDYENYSYSIDPVYDETAQKYYFSVMNGTWNVQCVDLSGIIESINLKPVLPEATVEGTLSDGIITWSVDISSTNENVPLNGLTIS